MSENLINAIGIAEIISGLAAHAWFKRCDPVSLTESITVLAVVPFFPLVLHLSFAQGDFSIPLVLQSYTIFYAAVTLSITAYRLSPFHPLARFPGPWYLRVSKFWPVWVAYKGKYHLYVKSLHDKYGPIVRVGPNELSSADKELIQDVLGHHNMPKGPLWDGRRFVQTGTEKEKSYDSVIDVRDSVIHAHLRKPWSKAFSAEPMIDYENMLIPRVNELNQYLKGVITKSGTGVGKTDAARWVNYFAYDFMGDIAFGGAFDLMRDGDPRGQHQAMDDGMYPISITQHIPWIANLVRPFSRGMKRFINLGLEKSLERINKGMTKKDLFYYMAQSGDVADDGLEVIVSNCLLAIVAGSDTASSAMSNALYFLLSHPDKHHALQKEIDDAYDVYQIPDLDVETEEMQSYHDVLAGLKYLNAIINETLRLAPPIPTSLQRAPSKGSGGHMLTGSKPNIWLPEGNACSITPYVLHRDPHYFSPRPNDFVPERWIDTTRYITTRDAFIPFSYGQTNCVGRPLALMELRYVLATVIRNFHMEFDLSKGRPEKWIEDQQDRFTMVNGQLNVKISLRTKGVRELK